MRFALLLTLFFVCDVGAQSSPASSRTFSDTAFFNTDTVVLHSTTNVANLTRTFADYIARMRPLPGIDAARDTARRPQRIDIHLAEDERAFSELTGGAAPHWGAGIAMPDSGIIVMPAYSSRRGGVQDLGPVIRHEIAHIQLQRALPHLRIPRWFTEGYATWSAGQLDPDADWYLRLAFITGRAPSLDSLELEWPGREVDARVAYLLSASAVAYLQTLGPDTLIATFIDSWRTHGSFEESIRSTYLVSGAQFERLWSKHVRRHYGWLLFLAQGAVVWAFISVVAVAMIFLRRRRDRRRMEELRRNELPDSPAYWMDPPPDPSADAHAEHVEPDTERQPHSGMDSGQDPEPQERPS